MPFTVERLLDQPIVIASASDPFDLLEDLPEMMEEAAAAAYEISENPYIIYDFSLVDDIDFSELAGGFMNMVEGNPGSPSDAESRVLIVGVNEDWDIVEESFRQDNYGKVDIPTFVSVSEALQYIQLNRP